MTTSKVSTLLRQGIDAARRGERAEARKVLLHILELDDRNKTAWLWLSGVMVDIDDQILCLENVLTIDPENATAVEGLTKLRSWRATQEAEYETERATFDEEPTPLPPVEPEPGQSIFGDEEPSPVESQGGTRVCIHCGTVNPSGRGPCQLCGRSVDGGVDAAAVEAIPTEIQTVEFVPEYDDGRSQGLLSLGAAWIAAIAMNKRGAYELEIASTSTRRTVAGIVIGGILIPFLIVVLTGALVAASQIGDIFSLLTALAAAPTLLFWGGIPAAIGLVIHYYLLATVLYIVAWLLGGKASFAVHTQLFSVAYSATSLLDSGILIISGALYVALIEFATERAALLSGTVGVGILAFLGLLAGAYSLAICGQAISVAHRFSWLGGSGVMLLGSILYVLLIILLALIAMLIAGLNPAEIQIPFALPPVP
ncbi:MAG: hypothetical protein GQ526_09490 [Ardenticatenales bacterium]|nr:hypothetical protein [Ardenticatenales bacterium]